MPYWKQKQIHQIGQFFKLWIFFVLEIVIEKPKVTDMQLSKSIHLQAQTWECKSAPLLHEAIRTWEPSHVFWYPFFFTDEAYLLELYKIKIYEYHQESKSAGLKASFQEWKLRMAIQVQRHSDQHFLAGWMCQKLFDLYHEQFGYRFTSSRYFFLFTLCFL